MNIDWSDARAEDINQRAAVTFTWPYPDESNTDSASAFVNLVQQACDEHLSGVVPITYAVSSYEVGPAASGLFVSFLCTIVRDIRPYLDDAANQVALSAAARAVYRLTRRMVTDRRPYPPDWANNHPVSPDDFRPVFSEPMIVGLCYSHFTDNYSDNTRITIDSVCRSPYPEFMSASHPGGGERYTIRIWTGQTSYIYSVDGKGEALDHLKIRGRLMEALRIPNWFDAPEFNAPAPSERAFFEQSKFSVD